MSIDRAFIPEEAIALRRPAGPFHPAFHVICIVALPIITSVYVGVAERAAEIAFERAQAKRDDVDVQMLAGELRTELFTLRALWNAHVDNAAEFDFKPEFERSARSTEAKTAISHTAIGLVDKAMELGGGAAFFRKVGIERLRRDIVGSLYHPLHPKRQHLFSGRGQLGLPLGDESRARRLEERLRA